MIFMPNYSIQFKELFDCRGGLAPEASHSTVVYRREGPFLVKVVEEFSLL